MFPPGHNLQEIEYRFKDNAIPPIEDFNFSKWSDELGIYSTYGGATVFPVKMIEKDNDFLLSLDDINCPNRADARALYVEDINKVVRRLKERRPNIEFYIDAYAGGNWETFCDNVLWVYREGLPLDPEFEYVDIEEFATVCSASKR